MTHFPHPPEPPGIRDRRLGQLTRIGDALERIADALEATRDGCSAPGCTRARAETDSDGSHWCQRHELALRRLHRLSDTLERLVPDSEPWRHRLVYIQELERELGL